MARGDSIIMAVPAKGWPPYIVTEKKPHGIMVDVMRQIAATADVKLECATYPDMRALIRLRDGRVDAYPKSREWVVDPDNYLWTDPVLDSQDVLIFRKGNIWNFDQPHQRDGKRIGCVLGYRYPGLEPLFTSQTIKRASAPDSRTMLRMLSRRRTDAAVINKNVAIWRMNTTPDLRAEDFVFSDKPLASAPYAFAFTRTREWTAFIAHFNRELAAMKKDGRLRAILNKYR